MISKFAEKLVDCLYCQHDISDDEQELYKYGFFVLLSQILYLIIAIILGSIFKSVFESVIFYIAFQFIRRYAGGFHAKTETRCEILSTLSILCCIVLIKLSKMYDIRIALLSISLVFATLIFILCPLDTPEKPLNDKEYKYFRKISWIILSLIIVAIIVSFIFKFNVVFAPCCASLILEGVLIGTGKIKKVYNEKEQLLRHRGLALTRCKRGKCKYRMPMKIEQAIYISKANLMFSVCPRCHKAIEREYTNHCSSCGQKLLWQDIDNIKITYK